VLQFEDRAYRVVCDSYVEATAGTGIVHQAPAFGEDDHRVAIANGIVAKDEMPPCPIDDAGRFTKEVPDFEGMHVKVSRCGDSKWTRSGGDTDVSLPHASRPPTSPS
jgi:isoleucyl-tRNA synthetase